MSDCTAPGLWRVHLNCKAALGVLLDVKFVVFLCVGGGLTFLAVVIVQEPPCVWGDRSKL